MCACASLATLVVYQGERRAAVERSEAMVNPMAAQVHYDEHRSEMAWVNEHDWQFERPVKRHPVRQAVAKALLALATALTTTAKQEGQTAS
jgi:hypothetical protein